MARYVTASHIVTIVMSMIMPSGVAKVFKWGEGGGADIEKGHMWCMNDVTCEGMDIVLSVLIHTYASV